MAPTEGKVVPKPQRNIFKTNTPKKASVKKTISAKNNIEQTPAKGNHSTYSVIHESSSKCEDSKEKHITCSGSVTKSAKKSWKKRPKPAHSGVPVPEKMKRILQKELQQDASF